MVGTWAPWLPPYGLPGSARIPQAHRDPSVNGHSRMEPLLTSHSIRRSLLSSFLTNIQRHLDFLPPLHSRSVQFCLKKTYVRFNLPGEKSSKLGKQLIQNLHKRFVLRRGPARCRWIPFSWRLSRT